MTQNAIPIPLEPRKFGISVAIVADRSLFSSAVFILAARADGPAENCGSVSRRRSRSRPAEKIGDLVRQGPAGRAGACRCRSRRGRSRFTPGYAYFELDQTHELWEQLKDSGGVAIYVPGEFPGPGDGVLGDSRLRAGCLACRTTTIPFSPSDRDAAAASRRRPTRHAGAAAAPAPRAAVTAIRADSGRGARRSRHRPQSAGAGGQPAAALDRPAARPPSAMDVAGLRRHALEEIRRFEEQARAAGVRNEIVLAARYALCAGLDEAVLSTPWGAQSEWAQHPAAGGAAPRGVGRREVLRDARPDLRRSGAPHRSDGAAVPRPRARLHRQVPGARPRPRAARRSAAEPLSHDPQQRGPAPTELSLRWRGLEDRRNRLDSLRAVVGRRAPRRWRCSP